MEVKSFNRETRCSTCLSLDRNLKLLKTQDYILLAMLCPATFSYIKHRSNQYLICWECEYMITKIRRFQARASKAQAQLGLKGSHVITNSLSEMETTDIETIDIPPHTNQGILMEQMQPIVEHASQLVLVPPTQYLLSQLVPPTPIVVPQQVPPTPIVLPQVVPPTPIVLTTLNVDPETIKIEQEEEEMNGECFNGDYDELIPTTTIESRDRKGRKRTLEQNMPRFQYVYNVSTVDVPSKHAVIVTDDEHSPQKVFIKAPKSNLAPRGSREAVTVTGVAPNLVPGTSVPMLVKRKVPVPTMVKTSDGFAIVAKDADGAAIVAPGQAGQNIVPINLNHEIAKREQWAYMATNPMNSNAQFEEQ